MVRGCGGTAGTGPATNGNTKRYLILTYAGEYDRVHYPLPLNLAVQQPVSSRPTWPSAGFLFTRRDIGLPPRFLSIGPPNTWRRRSPRAQPCFALHLSTSSNRARSAKSQGLRPLGGHRAAPTAVPARVSDVHRRKPRARVVLYTHRWELSWYFLAEMTCSIRWGGDSISTRIPGYRSLLGQGESYSRVFTLKGHLGGYISRNFVHP